MIYFCKIKQKSVPNIQIRENYILFCLEKHLSATFKFAMCQAWNMCHVVGTSTLYNNVVSSREMVSGQMRQYRVLNEEVF